MDYGIEWMDAVALWVAGLPGAFGRVTAFDAGPLLLATADLLLIGCLRRRCAGAAQHLPCSQSCGRRGPRSPTFSLPRMGELSRCAGAAGKLAVHNTGGDTFATREWLAADADGRDVHDRSLGEGIACDPWGCIGRLGDGRLISYVLSPNAFEEDCRRAAVVMALREPPQEADYQVADVRQAACPL